MAGHNKWSKVKNTKGAIDAKRGKLWTKLIKEITVSARMGGGNPDGNPRLRQAIQSAKDVSMPKENIERGIKKGTGELEGASIEEMTYEGYGPAGVAVIVEAATDNKNRTVSDLRKIFKKGGGNLGNEGTVAWMFERCGQLFFDGEKYTEDQVMEVALDAGAQDVSQSDGTIEVVTSPTDIYKVREAFDKVGMAPTEAGLGYSIKNSTKVEGEENVQQLFTFLETVEGHDDIQKVHANFEVDEKLLESMNQE